MTVETDMQAAEYVLGTLSAEERAEFEALLATDQAAQQAVAAWERRLAPLGDAVEDVTPPARIWGAIENALPRPVRPTPDPIERDLLGQLPGVALLRHSRDRWRRATYVLGALAAGLILVGVERSLVPRQESQGAYVAVVNRGGDEPALIIRVDLASRTVFVRPVAAEVPKGHSLELWYIGQGKTPKSMGLVDKAERKMRLPADASLEKADFAVTVEPEGGSPTGNPTGPIVYSGQLLKE